MVAKWPDAGPALDPTHVPVGVSARHVHLSGEDLERLFGKGYQLTRLRELQPGQFAAKECVTLVGPRGVLQNVRILGPARSQTQVEISRTDGYALGLNPPVRDSGDHAGSPGAVLVGPRGAVSLEQGVICPLRHIHMPPDHAERLGLRNKQRVRVRAEGERKAIFDEVLVRVAPDFRLELHLDTDEANASGLRNGDTVQILLE
ncbi:hypothetical protein SY88_08585 [Clostridiales bacterium PH28_bin88]|nr:hypothetical protein SY88_08585 [Clostridiales bacterium PH28_bin88]